MNLARLVSVYPFGLIHCWSGSDELEDLSAKVKSKLNMSLRRLTEPLSLGEIARTWDVCARAVISEYAQQNGGGNLSSKYGEWEDCLSAS